MKAMKRLMWPKIMAKEPWGEKRRSQIREPWQWALVGAAIWWPIAGTAGYVAIDAGDIGESMVFAIGAACFGAMPVLLFRMGKAGENLMGWETEALEERELGQETVQRRSKTPAQCRSRVGPQRWASSSNPCREPSRVADAPWTVMASSEPAGEAMGVLDVAGRLPDHSPSPPVEGPSVLSCTARIPAPGPAPASGAGFCQRVRWRCSIGRNVLPDAPGDMPVPAPGWRFPPFSGLLACGGAIRVKNRLYRLSGAI